MFALRSSYIPKSQSAASSMSVAGQCNGETQSDAQRSSSIPEHQLITQSIYGVQKCVFFTLPSETNLTLLQKPTPEWVTWNYFLGRFLKTELRYVPFPATTCQETPRELSQELLGDERNRPSCSASHLPQHGFEHVDTRVVWRRFCPLQILWINRVVLYIRDFSL